MMTCVGGKPGSRILRAMTAGLLASVTIAHAQTSPEAEGMAHREILMLQLVGGGALTPEEQQQAVHINQVALQTAPQAWARDDANSVRILQRLAAHDTAAAATTQEQARLVAEKGVASVLALQPVMDMERAIIRAHDPTVAYAAPNLVTEASLRTLAQAVAWTSAHGSLAPAPADLVAMERDLLRQRFASYPAELQTAYAHIQRNYAIASAFMSQVRPEQVMPFLQGHLANEPKALLAGPGSAVALMMQDLYNETVRRKWSTSSASSAGVAALTNSIRMGIMRTQWDTLRTALGRD